MSPQRITGLIRREVPLLRETMQVGDALSPLLETDLPALPVVDDRERLVGIFGEREFVAALFPGYVSTLGHAGFIPGSIEDVLEKRAECQLETVAKHMNTEHIDVPTDFSDVQVAETFLHHRVLIVPVTDHHRVVGVITRSDFFRALAERVAER